MNREYTDYFIRITTEEQVTDLRDKAWLPPIDPGKKWIIVGVRLMVFIDEFGNKVDSTLQTFERDKDTHTFICLSATNGKSGAIRINAGTMIMEVSKGLTDACHMPGMGLKLTFKTVSDIVPITVMDQQLTNIDWIADPDACLVFPDITGFRLDKVVINNDIYYVGETIQAIVGSDLCYRYFHGIYDVPDVGTIMIQVDRRYRTVYATVLNSTRDDVASMKIWGSVFTAPNKPPATEEAKVPTITSSIGSNVLTANLAQESTYTFEVNAGETLQLTPEAFQSLNPTGLDLNTLSVISAKLVSISYVFAGPVTNVRDLSQPFIPAAQGPDYIIEVAAELPAMGVPEYHTDSLTVPRIQINTQTLEVTAEKITVGNARYGIELTVANTNRQPADGVTPSTATALLVPTIDNGQANLVSNTVYRSKVEWVNAIQIADINPGEAVPPWLQAFIDRGTVIVLDTGIRVGGADFYPIGDPTWIVLRDSGELEVHDNFEFVSRYVSDSATSTEGEDAPQDDEQVPLHVFDEVEYSAVADVDFREVMFWLPEGYAYRRSDWPDNKFISMTDRQVIPPSSFWSPNNRNAAYAHPILGTPCGIVNPSITLYDNGTVTMGWLPNSEELFATDWGRATVIGNGQLLEEEVSQYVRSKLKIYSAKVEADDGNMVAVTILAKGDTKPYIDRLLISRETIESEIESGGLDKLDNIAYGGVTITEREAAIRIASRQYLELIVEGGASVDPDTYLSLPEVAPYFNVIVKNNTGEDAAGGFVLDVDNVAYLRAIHGIYPIVVRPAFGDNYVVTVNYRQGDNVTKAFWDAYSKDGIYYAEERPYGAPVAIEA